MEVSYESFLSSKPFLLVGPDKTHFYVHGSLIAKHSSVFEVEVNGPMREAETRLINVRDVDGDIDDKTVMRFIEFAYRGDYAVPAAGFLLTSADVDAASNAPPLEVVDHTTSIGEVVEAEPPIPETPPAAEDPPQPVEPEDEWGFSSMSKKKKKKVKTTTSRNFWYEEPQIRPPSPEPEPQRVPQKSQTELWDDFCAQPPQVQVETWQPVPNIDPRIEYTDVFLCHARLYVFSNRYECDALRDLCLSKLRSTLATFTLHQQRCADVVSLVRFTYNHTQLFKEGRDKLRALVSDYLVCKAEEMCCNPELLAILQDYDGLASDLMVKLMQRVY